MQHSAQAHPSAVVVSKKIKDILEKELKVKGLQFFPVPIKHTQSDKVIQGYYVMNVLNLIKDAVDGEVLRLSDFFFTSTKNFAKVKLN